MNFFDNHDVSRFLYGMNPTTVQNILDSSTDPTTNLPNGPDCTSGSRSQSESVETAAARLLPRLHAALVYQLTEDGIPCIYYGTEQEFLGGNDPANRERLWDTGFPTNGGTFRWIQQLTSIRRTYSQFRRGTMGFVWVTQNMGTESDVGMMAYERVSGPNYALVVIHAHDGTAVTMSGTNTMAVNQPPGTSLVNILGTSPNTVTVSSLSTVAVTLGPWEAAIFVPASQQLPLQ